MNSQTVTTDDGIKLHVETSGDRGKPALILCNSLGTRLEMWDPQMEELTRHFFVIRYDSRGHGRSDAPEGPYTIERLGLDAVVVLDGVGIGRAHWCGLSLGGMVGMWLATNRPERLNRVVLANTGAFMPTAEMWADRATLAREQGMEPLVMPTMGRWFTESFREREPETVGHMGDMVRGIDPIGYGGCCQAIGAMDQRETIKAVSRPVLVIAGTRDPSTPPAMAEAIRDAIGGAEMTTLDAAHLSNIEQPQGFSHAVIAFLEKQ